MRKKLSTSPRTYESCSRPQAMAAAAFVHAGMKLEDQKRRADKATLHGNPW